MPHATVTYGSAGPVMPRSRSCFRPGAGVRMIRPMGKGRGSAKDAPRISNRRALHDYFISAKLECGMALVGSEVKSLRAGKAQLQDAYAHVENGELYLHGAHID